MGEGVDVHTSHSLQQFFSFQTMKLAQTIVMPSNAGVTSLLLQRDNGLLAVTCDDLLIRIIDIETARIVRELSGIKGRILDVVSPLLSFL